MPRLRPLAAAAVLLTLAAAPAARADVGDYLGKPVASVRLLLDGRETTDPAFVQVVETRVGQPLSMMQVRESITHLFSLGRFEKVRVDASVTAAGVALRYELSPIHLVSKIEFTGKLNAPGIDSGELRRAITNRYGASPPLGRAGDVSTVLVETLRQRGYRHPTVKPRAELGRKPEQATLVFDIDAGPRTAVGSIQIDGTPTVSREDFLHSLDLAPGKPYEPDALDARVASYIETRRRRGYYEARVTPTVSFDDGERVANLTLTVMPGPHVRVIVAGDTLPSDRLAELVPVEREGSADEDLLEDSSVRIEEYLRGQGYREATAPHTRKEANGELLITFTVHKGPQYRISRLEISGNVLAPLAQIQPLFRSRAGAPFSSSSLDADVATVENYYRRLGFRAVAVRPAVEPGASSAGGTQVPVVVRFTIVESVRTVVGEVHIDGNASIPTDVLRPGLSLQPGAPYFEPQLQRDSDAIALQYANLGFRTATVDARPNFTADGTQANPVFTVREGLRLVLDHVLITGNVRIDAEVIERELQVKPGEPLGLAALNESKRRIAALGLFRRVEITEVRHNAENQRDLLITVEEAAPTTVGYGGGVEGRLRVVQTVDATGATVASDKFEVAPRASFEIGRRNLFGKNRSVNLSTGVTLYPKDSPVFLTPSLASSGGGFVFAEYRVVGTLHEPRAFNTAFDGQVTAFVERQIRSSFNLTRRGAGAQLARSLTRNVNVSGSYQIQHTELFDVQADVDPLLVARAFTQVRISSFSASASYSTRDDPLDPTNGEYLGANAQLAGRSIGSEVGFVKSSFTAQAFRPIPRTRRMVLAGNLRLGLATGFPRDVVGTDGTVQAGVRDLPEAERFFAGGDTTVRGFTLDTLGTPDTILNGFPIGGNALVIVMEELRVPIAGGLSVVGFVDTGNVFAHVVDVDLRKLRSAVGFGFRYKSPIGPLRFDVGFKVHPEAAEGPKAWFISFGQAF